MEVIDSFRYENFWLSNYSNYPVEYEGRTYANNYVALCSAKCKRQDDFMKNVFALCDTIHASLNLNKYGVRDDWDDIKYNTMLEINFMKFYNNPELKKKLLDTGDCVLIEGSTVAVIPEHSYYWGMVDGKGENNFGKILMSIRAFIKESSNE